MSPALIPYGAIWNAFRTSHGELVASMRGCHRNDLRRFLCKGREHARRRERALVRMISHGGKISSDQAAEIARKFLDNYPHAN